MKPLTFLLFFVFWFTFLVAQDGTLKWRYKTDDEVRSSPAVSSDGTIYVGSYDDYLYAINSDGSLKWRYKTGHDIDSSPAIDADGTVYVGSWDNYLYALNPDGSLKWRYETGNVVYSTPTISADRTVYVGSWDYNLYALNPNGTLKWLFKTGSPVSSSPGIGADGTIYVGSYDNYLYALKPNGELKWQFETKDNVTSSPAIGADGTVYVGSRDNYLYALNPDGSLKWQYETGYKIHSSPAIDAYGTVYVGSIDTLYALNSKGRLKWNFKTEYTIYSSPAVGADNTVFIGSLDHYLYALNPDGILKWRYKTGSCIWSSPTIGTDGTVYVGSCDNYVYSIETNCSSVANSPWPMWGSNAQHTGLFPIPFYYSIDTFKFHSMSDNFKGNLYLMGQNTAVQIISWCFSHPSFTSTASLPCYINADQNTNLPYIIQVDSSAIYKSICTLNWQSENDSRELILNLSQGIIVKDGSETDMVGSQVLAAYNSSFAKDPQSIATKNNLALLYRICGEPERTDRILSGIEEDALNDYYCTDVYLLNRGVTQSDLNQPDTAVFYFNGVLSNESETMCAKAWYNQGWEAYQQSDYNQVILYTDSVIASSQVNEYTLAKAWCLRGAAQMELDQEDDAKTAFNQAITLDPHGPIGALAQENLEQTGVDDDLPVPARFQLYANYPNPFNPSTTIAFDLPQAGKVTVIIFNTLGRQVRRLHQGLYPAGHHTLKWNALDDKGRAVSSGIYVLKVTTNDEIKVRKLTLMR